MAYLRCDCTIGDIPHPTDSVHKRRYSRCTRVVEVSIRRRVDTGGRTIKGGGPWYHYCRPCGNAIMAYQGSSVECREGVEL